MSLPTRKPSLSKNPSSLKPLRLRLQFTFLILFLRFLGIQQVAHHFTVFQRSANSLESSRSARPWFSLAVAAPDWLPPRRTARRRSLADALLNTVEQEREQMLSDDWPVSNAYDGHARACDFKLTFFARPFRVRRATRCERG